LAPLSMEAQQSEIDAAEEIVALVFGTAAATLAVARLWPQLQTLTPALSAEAVSTASGLGAVLVVGAGGVLVGLLPRFTRRHTSGAERPLSPKGNAGVGSG